MRLIRKAAPALIALTLALSLGACAQSERKEGSGDTGGDTSTFTFGAAGEPKLFDPFYATDGETFRVTRQMMDGLVGIKAGTAEVEPRLATEWEPDESGMNWTFTLRDDVKFTDGEPFNAEAVCYNFNRMFDQGKDGQSAAEYWSYTMGAFADNPGESLYKDCTVVDDTHATIGITRVTSSFPSMLVLDSFSMQSPKALEEGDANNVVAEGEGFKYPEYAMNAVGTGPYKLDNYDAANKTVTLVRNDDYWGEPAKTAKLVFKIIPDESTRRQELQAGSIDGYDFPNPVDWPGLEGEGNSVEVRPAFNILYMGLNAHLNPKLKDIRVRQALYHALNREQLVASQLPEGATVATQFMPDTVSGYNANLEPYAYDPEKAKALLKEAGAEGMTLKFWYPTEVSRPYMPDPQKLYEALRSDFEAVGIKVEVGTKSWNGGYLDDVSAGKYEAWLLGWTGDFDAASNFIGTFFGNYKENELQTDAHPWGKQLDEELKAADGTVDEAERTAAYEALNEKIMMEYLPGLAISHAPPALVVSKDVSGLIASPLTAETFSSVEVGGK